MSNRLLSFSRLCAPLCCSRLSPHHSRAGRMSRRAAAVSKARSGSAVYIVQMIDPPVAGYTGGRPRLSATAPGRGQKINRADPDVVRYAGYLDSRHDDVVARVGARKLYGYRYAFNGFTARLTREQVAAVKAIPDVIAVEETREIQMDTATTPAFLGLTETGTGLWTRGIKGENVIIGILDSGIWPESQSFSDRTGVGPNGQKGKLAYHQIPGWHGKCASEEETDGSFDANLCNQKLIGAQFFCVARGCDTVLPHEFLSPRDYNGHGTHTASTAGGNEGVVTTGAAALFGSVNGIAPRARIAAYKVCWDNGQAVLREYRRRGGRDRSGRHRRRGRAQLLDLRHVDELSRRGRSGVPVRRARGRVRRHFGGEQRPDGEHRGAHQSLAGVGRGGYSQPIRHGEGHAWQRRRVHRRVADSRRRTRAASCWRRRAASPEPIRISCVSASRRTRQGNPVLDPAKVAGKIVVCERGGAAPANARVDKSLAVKNAGGVGVVIYNVAASTVNADLHSLPTVHVDHVEVRRS